MQVDVLPEARGELLALPQREYRAMVNAIEKLRAFGDRLGYPHTSAIEGVPGSLRELRPRAGRSPWRAIYRRIGHVLVIGAVGPEASSSPAGFRRAVSSAADRLDLYERDQR